MGLVDENRQRLPSYYAWKDETSPARLTVEWTKGSPYGPPTGFRATVTRRPPTELPSYDLRGYRLEWEARDHDGALLSSGSRTLPVVGAPANVDGSWPATASREVAPLAPARAPDRLRRGREVRALVGAPLGGLSPEQARKEGLATP